ncbi:ABC transporter substrate-binding protein [Phytohabitans aurantiacus]|uniref:ABC transporter substrate-binding protein n=1 Tax=Phytohabitans aurantiacus TaxID=3016789 RepID=A0ABQ5R5W7_9ACTN|nr:ABC transporter substrate-binding protein [Phytohabitans aurantiacus]GLI02174.1 ABC transporter substrate-binding protein [Phytohabitans aurantiacus]
MKRRSLLLAAAATALAPAVAACGKDDSGQSGGKTTITFWNGFTDADRPVVEEIVRRFNSSQSEVVVDMTIQPWDTINQSLLSAYAAKKGPTIVGLPAEQFTGYVTAGVWADVEQAYSGGGLDPATLPKASIDATTYKGKRYGVPMSAAAGMLYYNKALFTKAGLTAAPTSMAQVGEYAVKLSNHSAGDETKSQYGFLLPDHGALPHWAVLWWADGGGVVAEDNSRSLLGDPASIATAQYWTDLIANKHISPAGVSGVDADNLFAAGRAGMVINGPWSSGAFTKAGIDFGIAPVPPGSATQAAAAISVNMQLAANASDAQKEAATKFFAFWNNTESQTYWAVKTGYPPNRTDVPASALAENPTSAGFSAAKGARLYLAGLAKASQIDTDVVVPTVQKMTQGKGTAAQLLPDAAKQIDALL